MYIALVTLSLILVFGSSTFMSIAGLLSIFTNNTIIIICMRLGMEIGKILTISHLYRSWRQHNTMAKTWYIIIVFVLTFLTSFKVLGFLSQCHQKAVQENHVIQVQINALDYEESVLRSQIMMIDTTLDGLPNHNSNPVTAVAEIFGIKGASIISTFIPLLVLILEPLTIGLTIAANSAWLHHGKNKKPILENNLHRGNNSTNKLKNLQKKYNLSVAQIAKITGRKKSKTCEGWLKGIIPTPPRALTEVQTWVEKKYVKKQKE